MFDLYGNQRLAAWKQFRSTLENSNNPLLEVAEFWANAPFVSSYLNPSDSNQWPDPWHLVLDSALDELAIVLGMLYTIKLTQRFIDTDCEIHMSMLKDKKEPSYFLVVDKKHVLNLEYKSVVDVEELKRFNTSMIWSKSKI